MFGSSAGASSTDDASHHTVSRRLSTRLSRYQSLEDDLWGWFGDDRPSETGSDLLRVLSRGGDREGGGLSTTEEMVGGGGGDGDGRGGGSGLGDTEVTVSTLALTERLAKLSAGRALLDRVKEDTRSLASFVFSAVRSTLSPSDDAGADAARVTVGAIAEPVAPGGGEAGGDRMSAVDVAATASTHVPAEAAPASSPARAVHFTPDMPQEDLQAPGMHRAGGDTAIDAAPASAAATATGAAGTGNVSGYGETPVGVVHDALGQGGRAGTFRQRVVEAKTELMGLQRDIRRAVREVEGDGGAREEARGNVAALVARRATLAAAALPDAKMMAVRLQEISEAQKVRGGGGSKGADCVRGAGCGLRCQLVLAFLLLWIAEMRRPTRCYR